MIKVCKWIFLSYLIICMKNPGYNNLFSYFCFIITTIVLSFSNYLLGRDLNYYVYTITSILLLSFIQKTGFLVCSRLICVRFILLLHPKSNVYFYKKNPLQDEIRSSKKAKLSFKIYGIKTKIESMFF